MAIAKNYNRMLIRSQNFFWAVRFLALFVLLQFSVAGQEVVDKTVAVVGEGRRAQLITYSDLVWQLALQPNTPIDPPRSEDLNRALQLLINQRLFALEAERLPRAAPTEKEIADKISQTLSFFPSPAVFEARLKQVGFDSIKDEAFERLMAQRVAIEKYADFRFNSFVVVTPDEETSYYRNVYVPEFRRRSPGLLVPTLEEKRREIRETLSNQKVASAIERFIDETKRRVPITVLIEV